MKTLFIEPEEACRMDELMKADVTGTRSLQGKQYHAQRMRKMRDC